MTGTIVLYERRLPDGKINSLYPGDVTFANPEKRLKEWLAAGNDRLAWPNVFGSIKITDKTPQELRDLDFDLRRICYVEYGVPEAAEYTYQQALAISEAIEA